MKDKFGRVQTCSDGKPAAYLSDCGFYTVSRALTNRGALFDGWRRNIGENGRWNLPVQLVGGVSTPKEAIAACEADHGRHTQSTLW